MVIESRRCPRCSKLFVFAEQTNGVRVAVLTTPSAPYPGSTHFRLYDRGDFVPAVIRTRTQLGHQLHSETCNYGS